jgi:hypothetical protein
MTPLRTTLALMLMIVAMLLAIGCVGENKAPNDMVGQISDPHTEIPTITSTVTVTPTPCRSLNTTGNWICISPIGDHAIGEKFWVNGTTNLPVREILIIEVYSATYKSSLGQNYKETASEKYARIPVMKGIDGYNIWESGTWGRWEKDEVIALVSARNSTIYAIQLFNITWPMPQS